MPSQGHYDGESCLRANQLPHSLKLILYTINQNNICTYFAKYDTVQNFTSFAQCTQVFSKRMKRPKLYTHIPTTPLTHRIFWRFQAPVQLCLPRVARPPEAAAPRALREQSGHAWARRPAVKRRGRAGPASHCCTGGCTFKASQRAADAAGLPSHHRRVARGDRQPLPAVTRYATSHL